MSAAALAESSLEGNLEHLAAEPALPSQFHDVWWRSHRIAPAPRLALAVLQLAVVDLLKFRDARDEAAERLYREAHVWIMSADRDWPFSFLNLCDVIRISAPSLRDRVLSADEPERARALREVGKLLDICHG
jgi:hypothetical protein